jgi:hypothetical protein
MRVAIASENTAFDAELYRHLLARVLGLDVTRWESSPPVRFSGWEHVRRQAPAYLKLAAAAGVRHAVVAIDNDGGAKRRPVHDSTHLAAVQAADVKNGCGTCLLLHALSHTWTEPDYRRCIVVPVQALETWLLAIRGFAFSEPTPEQCYDRAKLKKSFFPKPLPPEAERTQLALSELSKPEAITILRKRPSFLAFEAQLASWQRG